MVAQGFLVRQMPVALPPYQAGALPHRFTRARPQARVNAGKVQQVVEKIEKKLEEIDDNVLQYCSLDKQGKRRKGKMSMGEKEAEFLDALRSFYYDDKPSMSNEEFDNLKEELLWEGSKVAVLSSTEQRFMEASLSFQAGKPILSDEEYDQLKQKLQNKNSKVVQQGPRCSLRTRNVYSDANPDYVKMTALNIPAILLVLGALFSIDDLTGFEITKFIELPPPFGIITVWGLVLPSVFLLASSITNLVLKDGLILQGPCPNCNTPCTTYFGDILTISGNRELNQVVCSNCKTKLDFNAAKRQIIQKSTPGSEEKKKPAPKKDSSPKKDSGDKKPAAKKDAGAKKEPADKKA